MLISDRYRRLNRDLHRRAVFGQRGARHALVVQDLLEEFGAGSVLDYGCGRGDLAKALPGVEVVNYDPGTDRYAGMPKACDYVVCTDVLEHVEPDCLADVLEHIAELTGTVAHLVIATKPDGSKKLADGRDPHLIVRSPEWWRSTLAEYFTVRCVNVTARDCTFRAVPKA